MFFTISCILYILLFKIEYFDIKISETVVELACACAVQKQLIRFCKSLELCFRIKIS
jgi:hypothetical protein